HCLLRSPVPFYLHDQKSYSIRKKLDWSMNVISLTLKNPSSLSSTGLLKFRLVLDCGSLHLLSSVTGERFYDDRILSLKCPWLSKASEEFADQHVHT
ncbi:hypothetical protein STEG23_000379, partial [Scotinomys teguina]